MPRAGDGEAARRGGAGDVRRLASMDAVGAAGAERRRRRSRIAVGSARSSSCARSSRGSSTSAAPTASESRCSAAVGLHHIDWGAASIRDRLVAARGARAGSALQPRRPTPSCASRSTTSARGDSKRAWTTANTSSRRLAERARVHLRRRAAPRQRVAERRAAQHVRLRARARHRRSAVSPGRRRAGE